MKRALKRGIEYIVLINPKHLSDAQEAEWTIAHEIAHAYLDHYHSISDEIVLDETEDIWDHWEREAEANKLAAWWGFKPPNHIGIM